MNLELARAVPVDVFIDDDDPQGGFQEKSRRPKTAVMIRNTRR